MDALTVHTAYSMHGLIKAYGSHRTRRLLRSEELENVAF